MKAKISIAEILQDKPQGTKLYSLTYGDCFYQEYAGDFWIGCKSQNGVQFVLDEYGRYCIEGECILFPSKEMQDWEKFAWKRGDVLAGAFGALCIFEKWANDDYTKFDSKFVTPKDRGTTLAIEDWCKVTNKAVIKQYISDIEENNGGKLNLTTLDIEKTQPEFKDGDIVCISGMGYLAYGIVKSIDYSSKKLEYYVLNDMSTLNFEDWLSFEDKHIQPITETQQIILFDALEKEGKAWDAEKKQIVDLKPKVELKPFDKVLSRRCSEDYWVLNFYSHKTDYYHICIDGSSNLYCIPYNEETAHLLGTTDEWKGGEG